MKFILWFNFPHTLYYIFILGLVLAQQHQTHLYLSLALVHYPNITTTYIYIIFRSRNLQLQTEKDQLLNELNERTGKNKMMIYILFMHTRKY